jgi:hypothetical protein
VHAVTHGAKITMLAWRGLLALTVALALGVVLVGTLPLWRTSGSGSAPTGSLLQTVAGAA